MKGLKVNKMVSFDIEERLASELFVPIRNRKGHAIILLKILKYLSIASEIDVDNDNATLILKVSKMSRVFLCSENKIFSIVIPFTVTDFEGSIYFESKHIGLIDNAIISFSLDILEKSDLIGQDKIIELAEELSDETKYKSGFWQFLQEILMIEEGYLRFERDQEHANGHLHPLNHLDIFYSNSATFKLGSSNGLSTDALIDILDLNTDCHYVSTAS